MCHLKWKICIKILLLLCYSYAVSSKIEPFYKGGKVQVRLLYTCLHNVQVADFCHTEKKAAIDFSMTGSQTVIQSSVKHY